MKSSRIVPRRQFLVFAHRVEQMSKYVHLQYAGHEARYFLFIPSMLQHDDLRVHELQSGQLGADLPEAFGSCAIVGDLRRAYRFLLDEIPPSGVLDRRGTGQVDDRLGTLLWTDGRQLQDAEEGGCDATV